MNTMKEETTTNRKNTICPFRVQDINYILSKYII